MTNKESMPRERRMLLKTIEAQQDLLRAYRIGDRPKSKSLDYLSNHKETINKLLAELK